MLPRPACPGEDVPADLEECIYRCFEAHRRRVLERRAARRRARKTNQQSFQTERYQNIPPQTTVTPSHYTNIIQQSSQQYQDVLPQTTEASSNYTNYIQDSPQYQNAPQQSTAPSSHYSSIIQELSQQYQDFLPQTTESSSLYSNVFQDSQQQQQQHQTLPTQSTIPSSHHSTITQGSSQQYEDYLSQPTVPSSQYSTITQESAQQYQDYLSQPTGPSAQYSNLIQESQQYQQLLEPTNETTIPLETSHQHMFEQSHIDQTTTTPIDTRYQAHITSTEEPYHQIKEAPPISSQVTAPFSTDSYEQMETSTEFKNFQEDYAQSSEASTFTQDTVQQRESESQGFDSHIINQQQDGSSKPTGTVEYSTQAYYSEEPILNDSAQSFYLNQTQSSENQQYVDNNISPPTNAYTFHADDYTNEQSVPQQPLSSYEEDQQHLLQQATFQKSSSPLSPGDSGSDEDVKEDEEIFDLRACICRCYAKFRNSWVKDQQERYQRQFNDIQRPFVQISDEQFQKVEQRIATPISSFVRPQIPPSIPHYREPTPISTFVPPQIPPSIPHYREPAPISTFVPPQISPSIPQYREPTPISTFVPQQISPSIPQYREPTPIPVPTYAQPRIPTPIPTYTQPPIPTYTQPQIPASVPSGTHQIIQQSNTFLSIHCDHQQPEQNYQSYEIHYNDRATQTQAFHSPIPPPILPPAYEQPPDLPPEIPMYIPNVPEIIDYPPPSIPEVPPPIHSIPVPEYIPPQPRYPTPIPPPAIPIHVPARPCYQPPNIPPGYCLVPCPETKKYAHLPPQHRPELFCVELPPESSLPPPPPPPPPPELPPPAMAQTQRWCVRCCCVPGQTLIKKITYREQEEEQAQEEECYVDYASVMDQLETRISVRYGDSIMEEGEAFVSGGYNEQLRIIDFPVFVSGKDDVNLARLVPTN